MAKKVMGDNRKAYVEKKPFYKHIWLWIVVILLIFAGIGIANGSNNNTTNKVSYANYKKVKLSKVNGTTKTEAKKIFNKKPEDTSTQEIEGVKTDTQTWDHVKNGDASSNITVGFEDGRAVNKIISGLKVKRNSKITLDDYDKLQSGSSKQDVIDSFGKPNGYTNTNILGKVTEDWSYTSDVKGDSGANFIISFDENGNVIDKTQTSMK